MKINEVTR